MEDEQFRSNGIFLGASFFAALEDTFSSEDFLNAIRMKEWLGQNIKANEIDGYRNLKWNNYKVVFDLLHKGQFYHMGVDFGQQAVHVTLGPGDVYSLYFRNPTVPEW